MPEAFIVYDLVEGNGKTIRENNLERQHGIPVGALVEVKYDRWYGGGACEKVHARLWVRGHSRDCDGSPFYTLSPSRSGDIRRVRIECGFSEDYLTPIPVTPALQYGTGALSWDGEHGNPER